MAYDPQKDRRRPRPSDEEPVPVDALLSPSRDPSTAPVPDLTAEPTGPADPPPVPDLTAEPTGPADPPPAPGLTPEPADPPPAPGLTPEPADPPPAPSVTPEPADPWPDRLLFGTGVSGVAALVTVLVVLRWLWLRRRPRGGSAGES